MSAVVHYSDMTPEQVDVFALLVVESVVRNPARYLDESVTPFATPRGLMGGEPPSRWRPWSRARWIAKLHERVRSEMLQQCQFARSISRGTP